MFLLNRTMVLLLVMVFAYPSQLYAASDSPQPATGDNPRIKLSNESTRNAKSKAASTIQEISKNIQSLKSDVVSLNKDLRVLEDQLLFPPNTKFSFFISLESGLFLTLESVKLKLDGTLVASHMYSQAQREALVRGGIHRLYVTNLSNTTHRGTVFFTGIGPNGRPYKRAENIEFTKKPGSGYMEVAITDDQKAQEPAFEIKQW